jgi:DNA topoisomerase I
LNRDQYRLYQLIWQRFVASQMTAAVYDTLSVEVAGKFAENEYILRASGSIVQFLGFLVVYEEAKDEDLAADDSEDTRIPAGIEEGQKQHLNRLLPEQHFTQPPLVLPKPHWCVPWKRMALAGHPPTHLSWAPSSSAAM